MKSLVVALVRTGCLCVFESRKLKQFSSNFLKEPLSKKKQTVYLLRGLYLYIAPVTFVFVFKFCYSSKVIAELFVN